METDAWRWSKRDDAARRGVHSPLLSLASWTTAIFIVSVLFSHTVALRLSALLAGTLLVLVHVGRNASAVEYRAFLSWLVVPFALWGLWALASFSWSEEIERTEKEFRNEVIYAFLALCLSYFAAQASNAKRVLMPSVAAGAIALCAIAGYQFLAYHFGIYVEGIHGGPGNLSSAVITLFPCALMFAWAARVNRAGWASQVTGWAVVIACVCAAGVTLNRTVWLAFGAQLLVVGAVLVFRSRQLPFRAVLILAALGTLVLTLSLAAMLGIQTVRLSVVDGDPAIYRDARLSVWPVVIEEIKQRPWTGMGFGRGMLREALFERFDNGALWHAHNLFLDTAMQVGLPGLALFLILLGSVLYRGLMLARASDTVAVACGLALVAVVVGMITRNMTDTLLVRQNALLFWAVIGVLFAWGQAASTAQSGRNWKVDRI